MNGRLEHDDNDSEVFYYAAFRDQTLFTRYEKDFKQYLKEMRPHDFEYRMYHLTGEYKYNVIVGCIMLAPVTFLFGGLPLVGLDFVICFFSLFIPVKMTPREKSNYFIRAKYFCAWMERKYGNKDWYTSPDSDLE